MFKAHRHLYHSTLGSRVIKKMKKKVGGTTRITAPGRGCEACLVLRVQG